MNHHPIADGMPDANNAKCVKMIGRGELFLALVNKLQPIRRLHPATLRNILTIIESYFPSNLRMVIKPNAKRQF